MKSNLILIALTFLSVASVSGQVLREVLAGGGRLVAGHSTPVAMIEMLEAQLSNQFEGPATSTAQAATARVIKGAEVVSYGTIINGRDERFSYLLVPADSVASSGFVVQTQNGEILPPIAGSPTQLLSKGDNLAIIRLSRLQNVVTIKTNLEDSGVGAFVGILALDRKWKTGVVTNSNRTAYNGIAPGTQKALNKHWERIGLEVNQKRSGYPEVIETDLNLKPIEAGTPIFDRSGQWHGIAIARVDQHSTLVIPAKRVGMLISEFEIAHLR